MGLAESDQLFAEVVLIKLEIHTRGSPSPSLKKMVFALWLKHDESD